MNEPQALTRHLITAALAGCGITAALAVLGCSPPTAGNEAARPPLPAAPSLEQRVDAALDLGRERLEGQIRLTPSDKRFLLQAARVVLDNRMARQPRPIRSAAWRDVPLNLRTQKARLFVTLITRGITRGCMGAAEADLLESAVLATERAAVDERFGGPLRREEWPNTRIDVTILLRPQTVKAHRLREISHEIDLGIHAFSLGRGPRRAFFKSSVPVAHGYTLRTALGRLGLKARLGPMAYADATTIIRKYVTVHFAESPVDRSLVEVYRYNLLYPQSRVSRATQLGALRSCAEYMAQHVDRRGVLTYEYDVYADVRKNPDTSTALIRQLASTWVLAELGNHFAEPRYLDAARRSVDRALKQYYRTDLEKGIGYLQIGPDANLATAAFALLCLTKLGDAAHPAKQKALTRFILTMELKDKGCLNPVFLPDDLPEAERSARFEQKEVYYPGEALTALMAVHRRTGDPACLALTERMFAYYRALYDRTPKKASLTPWMSRAYAAAYLATPKKAYADFVFKMNDRLLRQQVGLKTKYVDRIGSFFTAASSTSSGVMIEGLVEAWRVAVASGDLERATRYREAILLGNRFLLQCQYRPENTFTAKDVALTLGGVRTTVYGSSIRIDAVQHTAAALLRTVQHVSGTKPAPP